MIDGFAARLDYTHPHAHTRLPNTMRTYTFHANYLFAVSVCMLASLFCTIRTRTQAHTQTDSLTPEIKEKKNVIF